MKIRGETVLWGLFAVGGVVAAMLVPITMIVTGALAPAGIVTAEGLFLVLQHPLTRIYLFVLISLSLWHAAHRTVFTLVDVGLKPIRRLVEAVLYGGALVGTILAVVLLVRL